jgi:hypothetical protein
MKVKLKYGISTYSGTIDEITFGSYKDGTICIARKWVMPSATEYNENMSNIAKNLSLLYAGVSSGYKADLKTYSILYGQQKADRKKLNPSSYALFVKMMYAFAESSGEGADLTSITLSDIQTLFMDISTIAAAVDAGYLPAVDGADALTETI